MEPRSLTDAEAREQYSLGMVVDSLTQFQESFKGGLRGLETSPTLLELPCLSPVQSERMEMSCQCLEGDPGLGDCDCCEDLPPSREMHCLAS